MRKINLFFILLALLFTSCIEIVEEIIVNKDLSGTIKYSLETNEMGLFFNNISGLFNASVEDQVEKEVQKLISKLENQQGITNLSYNLDQRSGDYYLSFDFKDYKKFNNALYEMSGNKKTFFTPSYFKIRKHSFKKINFSPWLKKYIEKENIEFPSPMITEMISFYSYIYLPDKISKVKPKDVIIYENENKTKQRFSVSEILNDKVNTSIKIKY